MEENGSEIITTDGSETVLMDGAEMLAIPEVHDPSMYETVVYIFPIGWTIHGSDCNYSCNWYCNCY